ncbi:MAG: ABC transporter permease [Armatimonadetes bacterium]|nr:ABC transporter permease [Armatimonadota bacterium]
MSFQAAVRSLTEHWQRAVLSAIGVAIASVAIILLISIGLGVQKDITSQVDDLGANMLIIVPGQVSLGGFNPNMMGKSYLTETHAEQISTLPGVKNLAKFSFAGGGVTRGENEAFPLVIAVDSNWFQMHQLDFVEGTPFTSTEDGKKVCVLGGVAKSSLFPDENAASQSVTINGEEFEIIGVTEDKGQEQSPFSMQSLSNVAYIPLSTIQSTQDNVQIDRIFIETEPDYNPESLIASIESVLAKSLSKQQFSVLTQEDLLKMIFQVMGILGTLVIGLTSIALFVGGIGIMAIMLMSVGERTKEIGIRKATGATKRDIFLQFLIEALIIGVGGVIAGLLISIVVIIVLANTTAIKPLLTPGTVLLAFGVGVGTGTIFGLLPALKASRLHPVEALRLE